MATSELAGRGVMAREAAAQSPISAVDVARIVLAVLASLRLTVVLFGLSIFLIFASSLAQKDHDVWYVVNDYFRAWFARIDFLTFERLVQIFFKSVRWDLAGWFYFPGGKLIGIALLINLAAAHSVRFKVAAAGRRLVIGCGIIALGLGLTYAAVYSGMNNAVESELSPAFCDLLWQVFRGTLAVTTLAGAYAVIFWRDRIRSFEWGMLVVMDVLLAGLTVWLLANPEARLDDSGLRILWQLVKGTGAGLALLVGCVLVFRKRAGIVLLHSGIALLMLSLMTGITAQESQMRIQEGATVNFSDDYRTTELAVIDRSHAGHDHVTVVPASLLVDNVGGGDTIEHSALPFKVQVHRWLENSRLRTAKPGEMNTATAGFGRVQVAEPVATATGVGEGANQIDLPAAYVELVSKATGKSLGTYLVSALWNEQPVEVDGRTYDLSLRFKRIYYPFSVTLKDFRFDRYTGTNTAKNFSSLVTFKDPRYNIDRDFLIWMNNPLRYAGTTFYQQSFDEATERESHLQVVTNPSWMTPYVACMLVVIGMFAHFGTMLVRFLRRRAEEGNELQAATLASQADNNRRAKRNTAGGRNRTYDRGIVATLGKWLPALLVAIFALYVLSKTRMPESKPSEMQIYEFGKLPLAYQGRVKPYDTLARNSLQILSGRQVFFSTDKDGKETRLPAIHWLLDAISDAPAANDHRIFRIENLDLLDALDLEHRPQRWRYSLNEINKKPGEFMRQIELVRDVPEADRSLFQHKVVQLASKHNFYQLLVWSFRSPPLSPEKDELEASFQRTQQLIAELKRGQAPHAVPPNEASTNWGLVMEAELQAMIDTVSSRPVNPAIVPLRQLLTAHARGDATAFNKHLADYRNALAGYERSLAADPQKLKESGAARAEILSQPKIDFEVFYNHFSPFYYAAVLYLIAFVLGAMSWIGWTGPLRRSSMWLLWFTFALHTFALVARVYISGRPPVTNLYSTAIFIGWGGALLALVFESIYRLGLGNIVAAVIGFLTLLVAYNLSLDGDTFIVLQAVLDTQFWLATHVVTINLGYATTYVAGLFGIAYLLAGHVLPVLDEGDRRLVTRIIYGTLCFAIFFSFVGTVLGGLWADDSWGRFWGWDPKENGALMIVLWNALVLHARWGGLVKGRGLATLAVAGNIVTTWSYFGVNELGVGLHAYGASEKNTGMWLLVFAASQLALVALGMMPRRWFEAISGRQPKAT